MVWRMISAESVDEREARREERLRTEVRRARKMKVMKEKARFVSANMIAI